MHMKATLRLHLDLCSRQITVSLGLREYWAYLHIQGVRFNPLIHVDLKTHNYLILFSTGSCLRFHCGRQRAGLPGSISGGLARCKMAGTQLRKRMAEWRVGRPKRELRGRVSAIVEERVLHGLPSPTFYAAPLPRYRVPQG